MPLADEDSKPRMLTLDFKNITFEKLLFRLTFEGKCILYFLAFGFEASLGTLRSEAQRLLERGG